MKLEEIDSASRGHAPLRRLLQKIQEWATGMEQATGVGPLPPAQGGVPRVAPPPKSQLSVNGTSGRFEISIVLAEDLIGPVIHEIKISETLPFIASTTVETLPENPSTSVVIFDPNVTKYFQLRSRYYTSDWNGPVITGAITSHTISLDQLNMMLGPADSGGLGYRLIREPNV